MSTRATSLARGPSGTGLPSIVDAMIADECHLGGRKVAIPRPEVHLVARFGPSARGGLDIHVLGARQHVIRKQLPKGQWTVMARLKLGTATALLGAPSSMFNGHVVPLEEVWRAVDVQNLAEDLATATTVGDAAVILEQAIAARLSTDDLSSERSSLIYQATEKLLGSNVREAAAELGMSERHLRRVFVESVGMSPKVFARLMRFSRAAELMRKDNQLNWARIAAAAGYYDQAHLIANFHAFAGTTPEAFRHECLGT